MADGGNGLYGIRCMVSPGRPSARHRRQGKALSLLTVWVTRVAGGGRLIGLGRGTHFKVMGEAWMVCVVDYWGG